MSAYRTVSNTANHVNMLVNVKFDNSLIENNQSNGILASLTGGNLTSSLSVDLTDSNVSNNAGDGINVTVDGTGTRGVVDITGTPVTGNSHDGFEYNVTGGARLNSTHPMAPRWINGGWLVTKVNPGRSTPFRGSKVVRRKVQRRARPSWPPVATISPLRWTSM